MLYVAITRAKTNLHIHYNQDHFKNYQIPGIVHLSDSNQYDRPDTMCLMLTMRQVWLDYFDSYQRQMIIEEIKPGKVLELNADAAGCNLDGNPIVIFSNKFKAILDNYLKNGYKPVFAVVRFIVYWKTETGKEIKIILPEIRFRRQ